MLLRLGEAVVIDLDALALADPAADVGCFLAYLLPTGLWRQRSGMRSWFDAAAQEFVRALSPRHAGCGHGARDHRRNPRAGTNVRSGQAVPDRRSPGHPWQQCAPVGASGHLRRHRRVPRPAGQMEDRVAAEESPGWLLTRNHSALGYPTSPGPRSLLERAGRPLLGRFAGPPRLSGGPLQRAGLGELDGPRAAARTALLQPARRADEEVRPARAARRWSL